MNQYVAELKDTSLVGLNSTVRVPTFATSQNNQYRPPILLLELHEGQMVSLFSVSKNFVLAEPETV